jgi:3,4-dihydroxy 2-butanone 4-phosphate synthase / GTP cyclohydrolase II
MESACGHSGISATDHKADEVTMKVDAEIGLLRRVTTARMPTRWGMFDAAGFERQAANNTQRVDTALAIVMGDLRREAPLLRIHSQCFTGEGLGSLRCDCSDQLSMAMQAIAAEGRGLVLYEYQEGRGIGLMAKLRAYELQDIGIDTVEANHALGFRADYRDYSLPVAILRELGVHRVRLLTNNPAKARALTGAGIEVVARIPCEATANPHSLPYLRTKKEKMAHSLSLLYCDGTSQSKDLCAVEAHRKPTRVAYAKI